MIEKNNSIVRDTIIQGTLDGVTMLVAGLALILIRLHHAYAQNVTMEGGFLYAYYNRN